MTALDFTWADALEEPVAPVLDPRVWVEPTHKGDALEITIQAAIVGHLRKHAKRCEVFAVPNAAIGGAKLRQYREGAAYGASDLIVAWTGGVAFLEVKRGRGSLQRNQVAFLNRMAALEHHVGVGRSVPGVSNWLHSIGAPVGAIA